jgi:hypothetical protein
MDLPIKPGRARNYPKAVKRSRPKYLFVTGGVMSGLGKGITTSSVAKLLELSGGLGDPYFPLVGRRPTSYYHQARCPSLCFLCPRSEPSKDMNV